MKKEKIKIGDIVTIISDSCIYCSNDFKAKVTQFNHFDLKITILSGIFGFKNQSDYTNNKRSKGYKSGSMNIGYFKLFEEELYPIF